MAKLRVVAAAEAAGVSRHTIWRYVKSGKLSATVGRDGERVIDTSELVRVFGDLHQPATSPQPLLSPGVQPVEPTATVAVLQRQIEEQRGEIERLRAEASAERDERRALQDRYLKIIERLQLTGPAEPKAAPRSRPKKEPAAPQRPASVLETVAGSVASWLSSGR